MLPTVLVTPTRVTLSAGGVPGEAQAMVLARAKSVVCRIVITWSSSCLPLQ
jgi:hypothetical protein